jgi:hypothetical protein
MNDLDMISQSRLPIYVAGPMTTAQKTHGLFRNIGVACELASELWRVGWLPFVPHLNCTWETACDYLEPGHPDGVGGWLGYDFNWVSRCAALVRIPGVSPGGDREVAVARKYNIPVLTPEEALLGPDKVGAAWIQRRRGE